MKCLICTEDIHNTCPCPAEYIKMPCPFLFSQSDYLIQIIDINSYTELQTVQIQISWLLRSQLIWIYTVCKSRVYLGLAGQGLKLIVFGALYQVATFCYQQFDQVANWIFRQQIYYLLLLISNPAPFELHQLVQVSIQNWCFNKKKIRA